MILHEYEIYVYLCVCVSLYFIFSLSVCVCLCIYIMCTTLRNFSHYSFDIYVYTSYTSSDCILIILYLDTMNQPTRIFTIH